MLSRSLGLALLLCAIPSCRPLGGLPDLRELAAHEQRYDALLVERLVLDVDVHPEAARLSVRARITLRNEGTATFARVELLANPELVLNGAACAGTPLAVETDRFAVGGVAVERLDIALPEPLRAGQATVLELDYSLDLSGVREGAEISARSGWVRTEAQWVPALHTMLSRRGMDRAPCELAVTLPDGLEPVGLGDFRRSGSSTGGRARFASASELPFQPFFAYGAFRRVVRGEGNDQVVAYGLDETIEREKALATWQDAARAARRYLEEVFGERGLPLKLVFVDGLNGAWGAPFCVLVDPDMLGEKHEDALWYLGHELAHTWWGDSVPISGTLGYVHEGLASASAIFLLGHELGRPIEAQYRNRHLRRFCAPEKKLSKPLAELTRLDPEYERGAYELGALFFCAVDERLGRERFQADLRAFARAYDGKAADLQALEDFLVEERRAPVADLFARWTRGFEQVDELWAQRPALLAEANEYWIRADTSPDPALQAEAEARIAEVVAELRTALGESASSGARLWERARERWTRVQLPPSSQVTVIDDAGRYVYHEQEDLRGDSLWYADVGGRSVYRRVLESGERTGSFVYYGYLQRLGETARRTTLFWTAIDEKKWFVLLEVHRSAHRL